MMAENNVWNPLWKAKGRSQSASLDDFETFEDGITSISKDYRSVMSERINWLGPISPLQLGKLGEKIYKVFTFWLKTPSATNKRKPKSSPC